MKPTNFQLLFIATILITYAKPIWPVALPAVCAFLLVVVEQVLAAVQVHQGLSKKIHDLSKQVESQDAKIALFSQNFEQLNGLQLTITKQADQTKKMLSELHLAQAFVPRSKRREQAGATQTGG